MSRESRAQKVSALNSTRNRAPHEEKYSLLEDGDQKLPEKKILTEEARVRTFKGKWKVKGGAEAKCTPRTMAQAGWFCTGADSACCFVCYKELEGFEPGDDPWVEHIRHSKKCPFGALKKLQNEMSAEEQMEFLVYRYNTLAERAIREKLERLEELAQKEREKAEKRLMEEFNKICDAN